MRAFARPDPTGSMPGGVASDRFGGIFAHTRVVSHRLQSAGSGHHEGMWSMMLRGSVLVCLQEIGAIALQLPH